MKTADYTGINTEILKKYIKICSKKSAVMSLRNDEVLLRVGLQFRNNLCPWSSNYGMISPEFQFLVNALNVSVI